MTTLAVCDVLDLQAGLGAPDRDLRTVFRHHATTLWVVTGTRGPEPVGFTASSVTSVSVDPPMLSFNVARTSSSHDAVTKPGSPLALHLLAEGQGDLALRFTRSGGRRFAPPTEWALDELGLPRLAGVLARVAARVWRGVRAGDHDVVVADVLGCETATEPAARPLLYVDGTFARVRAGG